MSIPKCSVNYSWGGLTPMSLIRLSYVKCTLSGKAEK
jgi:hypothetical protein